MPHRTALFSGSAFALAAGLIWGLVFVVPTLLPAYPAALLSFGRYLAFGLIALPLAWLDRARIAQLTRADWIEATKLSLIGNIVYYLFLAAAIQHAGGPLPTVIIGTLPVVIAISSNVRDHARDGRLRWRALALPLGLIALGIGLVNHSELAALRQNPSADFERYALGALLAVGAVVCWTWYPIRNADWLRAHADRSPSTWATAQGLATLPLALVGYLAFGVWNQFSAAPLAMPWGPDPLRFVALMLALGLLASWLGTLCWNEASQRLPTTLVGQLIVFETLAALAYAFVLRGAAPDATSALGIGVLVLGVIGALRLRPQKVVPAVPAHAP